MSRWRSGVLYALAGLVMLGLAALAWLRWEAHKPREDWFASRQGHVGSVSSEPVPAGHGQAASSVQLTSDSGLSVSLRVIRDTEARGPLPVMLVLGGHRTGSAAVELFGDVGERAVVALDYPYEGPQSVRGLVDLARTVPLIREAFLDTPPAVSLVVDWLYEQPWADPAQIVLVGASLGVPFATTAAARDERLSGLLLVHGAADNRLWLQENLARRIDFGFMQPAVATVLHWLIRGPAFDTREKIAEVAPRPVLIVGARNDERTPPGQAEALYDAAREPKMIRWTEGQHVAPGRSDIIDDLLRIADQEQPFFAPAS